MDAELEEDEEEDHHDDDDEGERKTPKGDSPPKNPKQKRAKPRRQSGTAVAFQKRSGVRNLPERTTSNHLVERKGRPDDLAALVGPTKQDRRGSQGQIKKATSAMRAARGVPTTRGVSRAASSQQAPRRPDRAVAPAKKSVPARSSSTHSLKQFRKDRTTEEPTLTGADLLNLRKAQKADLTDADSVQSDMESTYTMDSINLRKSQIHHEHETEGKFFFVSSWLFLW